MPFLLDRPIDDAGTIGVSEFDKPDPTFLETLFAAYRNGNMVGSTFTRVRNNMAAGDVVTPDPDYNVYQDPEMKPYLLEDPTIGEDIFNRAAAGARRAQIDQEKRDQQTLAASGWTGKGLSMLAGLTDLPTLLPGGSLVRSGRVGYSVLRSAAAKGVADGVGTALQEAVLHATQETRTGRESVVNIGGSVILGGLLGAGASRLLSHGEWSRASKQLEADLADDVPNPAAVSETIVKRMQSAGAAATDDLDLSDLGIGGSRTAEVVARATAAARINPGIQTMLSLSAKVREIYRRLVDNPIDTTMNMEGRSLGADVENSVKLYERGAVADWRVGAKKLYRDARKTGYLGTWGEFLEAAAKAGRRNDIDPNGNEFVTRVAQEARAKVVDPLLARAKELELLPRDVKTTTAASYVTRLWNRPRLIGEETRFREISRRYFNRMMDQAVVRQEEIPEFLSTSDRADYVEEIVSAVFNNLTGRGVADVPEWLVPVKRGPLKEKVFNIADEEVEDFLENDMERILRRYARTMAAEVELTQKFGRADMKEQFDEIIREYDGLRKAATTPEERQKLVDAEKRDMTNLQAFRDMIRGTYRAAEEGSAWSAITRAALTWNRVRLMDGVAMPSLVDAANVVGKFGMQAFMSDALPALVSGTKAARIARQDARDLGLVTERVLQARLASLADLQDPYRYGSRYEKLLSNASDMFSKATALSLWNDTMRTVVSVMSQNRLLQNIEKATAGGALDFNRIDKAGAAYMAMLGIDEHMAQRIGDQFRRHGLQEEGIYGANASRWDDEVARRVWAAALNKDADRTIIIKGVADNPLWMKSNLGKLVFQFKSFALASHQRILIAGLQERPHRLAEAMVFATGIGMMISYLKHAERGDFDEADRLMSNPGLWIANGLDRSGILAIPFEISTVEKLGGKGGVSAAQAIAGDKDRGGSSSRYASRGPRGAVGGPSVGLFEDLHTLALQASGGDFNKAGANALLQQIPGAGLPEVRSAIHFGIKPALVDAVEN